MRLIVVRHAIAQERQETAKAGRADAERRLTRAGRARMRAGAAGLARLVERIDVLAASPLVRAAQTAEIVRKAFDGRGSGGGGPAVARVTALSPGKPVDAVLHWLQGQRADATIAIVGHEPQLGRLVSWLLSGEQQRAFVELKKGSACLLEFEGMVKAGAATLLWMIKPSQLRRIGGG